MDGAVDSGDAAALESLPSPVSLHSLQSLLDERDIRNVVLRYCRAIDRRQYEMVRECYHPDAIDEHGDFTGTVDEFLDHVRRVIVAYECTMHFLGNILVDLDPDGRRARCESYAMAMHRIAPTGDRPARDHVVGLRYIDDFDRRDGSWRIAHRVCVFEWVRTDPVPAGWQFTDAFERGRTDATDVVFRRSLAERSE